MKNGSKRLPAYIIPPVSITKANYKQLFNGYLKKSEGLRRRVQEVLQVGKRYGWGPSCRARPTFLSHP